MTDISPAQLHTVAGLFLAVLAILFIAGKVFGKFLDDWWEKSSKPKNGNGKWDADRIMERVEDRHDRLREILHQNHAATLSILTQMAAALDSRRETERDIAVTLKLIETHIAEGRRA